MDKAISLVKSEQELIALRLSHPEITASVQEFSSPFYWSDEYSQIDLMELVCALQTLRVIRTIDGSPAELTAIVSIMEWLFHVKIADPNKKKWLVINRKNKLTHFIDSLRTALIDLSQK